MVPKRIYEIFIHNATNTGMKHIYISKFQIFLPYCIDNGFKAFAYRIDNEFKVSVR